MDLKKIFFIIDNLEGTRYKRHGLKAQQMQLWFAKSILVMYKLQDWFSCWIKIQTITVRLKVKFTERGKSITEPEGEDESFFFKTGYAEK